MAIFDLSLLARLGAILGILVDALWLFALTQASTHLSLSLLSLQPGPHFYISKPDSMPTLSTPLALHRLHEKGLQN